MSDSNDPQPGDINVGFDGTNIRITINDTINIPISDTTLPENYPEFGKNILEYMMIRTICDIIKDATNATITVSKPDIIPILKEIFPPEFVFFFLPEVCICFLYALGSAQNCPVEVTYVNELQKVDVGGETLCRPFMETAIF
jgi:hypothetical protein